MHSTACGAATTVNTSSNINYEKTDGLKMVHHNDDAMNKMPLKPVNSLDDEEKYSTEFVADTATAEDARREQMRVNILHWMKKLTIVLICFIGIALISYVVISLCFSDWSRPHSKVNPTTIAPIALLPLTASNITLASVLPIIESTSTPITITRKSTSTTKTSMIIETEPHDADNILLDLPPSLDVKYNSKLRVYNKAAVASDKEVCSKIGRSILKKDGSAVDAAISVLLCLGLVQPQSSGIGGGMLMNVFIKRENKAMAIDAREVAPSKADNSLYKGADDSLHSGLAIGVPGELMGQYRAHELYGKLPWKSLIEPSLKICEDGFYMTTHLTKSLLEKITLMNKNTTDFDIYKDATTGKLYPLGTKLKIRKELCQTYHMLAENGPLDFYNGTLAKLVAADLKDLGSVISFNDLQAYSSDLVSSISMHLGDDIIYAIPPVSSGTIVANILSILEGYNLNKSDLISNERLALTIHRISEAMKFGYAKRFELGDGRFSDVRSLVTKLTDPENGDSIRARIDDNHVLGSLSDYDANFFGGMDNGTSHISVIAPNGDAVSVTSSINHYFGSGQPGKRTGIIFNSGMNDFSIEGQTSLFNLPVAKTNTIQRFKRPMSSMSPTIIATSEGDIRMIIGSAGGSRIISAVVEAIIRVLWFGQDIKQAIDAPRFYHQLEPNILEVEDGYLNDDVIEILKSKGQNLKILQNYLTAVNGIVKNETAIYANADFRKRGGVAGF